MLPPSQILACPGCRVEHKKSRYWRRLSSNASCPSCRVALEPQTGNGYGLMCVAIIGAYFGVFTLARSAANNKLGWSVFVIIIFQTLLLTAAKRVFTSSFIIPVDRPFARLYLSELITLSFLIGVVMLGLFLPPEEADKAAGRMILIVYPLWAIFEIRRFIKNRKK